MIELYSSVFYMTAWGLILDVRPKEERKIQKEKENERIDCNGPGEDL